MASPEAAALDIIRTETVLSRLPVHNLAKKGSIKIRILQKTESGEIELLWDISPSRDYGEPRQLAYKLDTIVINQRIDEAGRPLPKILRLGSLNEICDELGHRKARRTEARTKSNVHFFQNVGALVSMQNLTIGQTTAPSAGSKRASLATASSSPARNFLTGEKRTRYTFSSTNHFGKSSTTHRFVHSTART